ncbi:hypothetical protein B9G55_17560 [Saccharibacillus sp. O16]|nr:hypothetical protein B9G55_17560 [Saccharibacillus sp. O16]
MAERRTHGEVDVTDGASKERPAAQYAAAERSGDPTGREVWRGSETEGRGRLPRLRVSANHRYLETEDGQPFFWLGDTAWELLHRLSGEDAEHYLRTRAEQGFTVVQAVLLAELDGVKTPNAGGRLPLLTGGDGLPDPARPDLEGPDSYWDHVDALFDLAEDQGLYVALLPTWGDKFNAMHGVGPEIFTAENAYAYGRWLGERYGKRSGLIWVLGGDRPLSTRLHFAIVDAMVRGLKDGGAQQLMTFHPKGAESSSYHLHDEEWLDFNMIQSGHGERAITNDRRVQSDYARLPIKPVLDAEPCYEDIPVGFQAENGYFDEVDVRRAAYYAVLSGAFGHTYGHHSVWPMVPEPGLYASTAFDEAGAFFLMSWKEALHRPGAVQMRHLRTLIEPLLGPDYVPDLELLAGNLPGDNRRVAARNLRTALIYCPNGLYVEAAFGRVEGREVEVGWFCPRTGSRSKVGRMSNSGVQVFRAPSSGRGCDWILTIEGV